MLSLGLAIAPLASAGSDALIAGVDTTNFSGPIADGSAQRLDWVHDAGRGRIVTLGATYKELAGTRMRIARAGGALTGRGKWTFTGFLQAGPVDNAADEYTFTQSEVLAAYALSPRLGVSFGARRVEAGEIDCTQLQVQATRNVTTALSVRFDAGQSVEGSLTSRYAIARLDYLVRRMRVFGGSTAGDGVLDRIELENVAGSQYYGVFGGVEFPVRVTTVAFMLDWMDLDGTQQSTAALSIRIPLQTGS